MPPRTPVAVVTGANRGIGQEVAFGLADRGLEVILTARDQAKAAAAAQMLWDEGLDNVHPRVVDVASDASVEKLRQSVEQEFGRADVLINNAGVLLDDDDSVLAPDLRAVHASMEVNAYGALRMAVAFVPLMRRAGYGRVVNVSTGMSQLGSMRGNGPGYRMSKVALNAVTRMLAAELEDENVLVNAASPGWVRSDMGGEGAPRSVAEGADTILWLATLPDDGPRGGLFKDREPLEW